MRPSLSVARSPAASSCLRRLSNTSTPSALMTQTILVRTRQCERTRDRQRVAPLAPESPYRARRRVSSPSGPAHEWHARVLGDPKSDEVGSTASEPARVTSGRGTSDARAKSRRPCEGSLDGLLLDRTLTRWRPAVLSAKSLTMTHVENAAGVR